MYYKGRVAGLDANRRYSVTFEVEIATSVPNGCSGVGGSPGEGVTVKAGASDVEPESVVEGADWRMNIDKGNPKWIELAKNDGTIDPLYDYWILGHDAEPRTPRWSIIGDVLHRVE